MDPPVAGLVLLPATNGASAENGASSHFQTGRSARKSKADHPSQAHHLSEQVSAEVITLLTFTAPQLMDRDYIDWLETLPATREVTQNFLGYGGLPAISTLISLQMFIHAPNPKFTPLGPSMNSWNSSAVIPSRTSQMQKAGPSGPMGQNEWL